MVEKKWPQSCLKGIVKLVITLQQLENEMCTLWEKGKPGVPGMNRYDQTVLLPLNIENQGGFSFLFSVIPYLKGNIIITFCKVAIN